MRPLGGSPPDPNSPAGLARLPPANPQKTHLSFKSLVKLRKVASGETALWRIDSKETSLGSRLIAQGSQPSGRELCNQVVPSGGSAEFEGSSGEGYDSPQGEEVIDRLCGQRLTQRAKRPYYPSGGNSIGLTQTADNQQRKRERGHGSTEGSSLWAKLPHG